MVCYHHLCELISSVLESLTNLSSASASAANNSIQKCPTEPPRFLTRSSSFAEGPKTTKSMGSFRE